jgi:hypothetical protein
LEKGIYFAMGQFSQLALCVSMPAEASCVSSTSLIFHGVVKPLVNNGEEERILGTDPGIIQPIGLKSGTSRADNFFGM